MKYTRNLKIIPFLLIGILSSLNLSAKEYHVSKTSNDRNPDLEDAPFRTIMAAANVAMSGDAAMRFKNLVNNKF